MSPTGRDGAAVVGLLLALGAFTIWGLSPLYFKAVGAATPLEVVAHRIVWSALMLAGLLTLRGGLRPVWAVVHDRRELGLHLVTTLLVSGNWLIFVWAIQQQRVLEASLGYYINPLVNVALGMLFLGERLRPVQWLAVTLAFAGVLFRVVDVGGPPWVALSLAFSFGLYGLLRKQAATRPLHGLCFETLLLSPLALAWLLWLMEQGEGAFLAHDWPFDLLLIAAGLVTAVPLALFLAAGRRLRYTTIGLVQYVAPTLNFVLAVALFKEPFGGGELVTFALIWCALALYSHDAWRANRRPAVVTAPT